MNYRLFHILIFPIVFSLASCAFGDDKSTNTATADETPVAGRYILSTQQFESSGMQLGKMEMAEFHEVVMANGMIDVPPKNRASVSAYFGGTVIDIQLLPGERVKKGQTLFIMENPAYVQIQQEYLEAKGQLSYLKSDYERQKNLARDNITSQKEYVKAESAYVVTNVKLESLHRQLELMNIDPGTLTVENIQTTIHILSPINGFVTNVNIARGAFLSPTHEAVRIIDTDHMHLELNIFEKDLSKIQVGQPIKFSIQEEEFREYDAVVHLINKTVDSENRTIGIHGHLANEKLSARFTPGMYTQARIYTSSGTRASLPQDAVVESDGHYYVLKLENYANDKYTFVRQKVDTGKSNDTYIEILNAQEIGENTTFLVHGSFNLITD